MHSIQEKNPPLPAYDQSAKGDDKHPDVFSRSDLKRMLIFCFWSAGELWFSLSAKEFYFVTKVRDTCEVHAGSVVKASISGTQNTLSVPNPQKQSTLF